MPVLPRQAEVEQGLPEAGRILAIVERGWDQSRKPISRASFVTTIAWLIT